MLERGDGIIQERNKMSTAPEGFSPIPNFEGYIDLMGPYFYRQISDTEYEYTVLTDKRYLNPNGVVHGGALVAFVDTCFGHIVHVCQPKGCVTVSLNSEFLSAVPIGKWITARVKVTKQGKRMVFARGDVFDGDRLLITSSGSFMIMGFQNSSQFETKTE